MESLEALKILCKLIPCTEVPAKEIVENYEIIKQDLERLKKMNEVWHKNEPMEAVDINAIHLQELYDFIKHLVEENIELRKKIENIKKLPNCDICDEEWFSCMCLRKKIKEVLGNE